MIDFTKVPNIHYWTQRVLPCVFDESLSYVEKINKLEEEINKLIGEYNTFGQNVVSEINTFEEETTNQINTFIQQVTDEINTFKSDITNQLNTFETSMTNKQNAFEARILKLTQDFETTINNDIATFKQTITTQQQQFENRVTEQNQQFMTQVNQSISDMQLIVDDIPSAVPQLVKTDTEQWLQQNAPAMIESSVANNVNKVFDVDNLIYVTHDESIKDLNNWTTTGIYYGTSLPTLSNYPANIVSGDMYWCFVGHTGTTGVQRTIQQTLYLNDGSCFTRGYVNISKAWDSWRRVSNTHRQIEYNTEIDFNTYFFADKNYGLNDTWTGIYQSSKWSNVPSDLKDGDIVNVNIYSYTASGNTYTVQVITKIESASNSSNIGKIWSRKKFGDVWSNWTGINNENLIINKTSTGINANSLKGNIIVTCDSASGAVNTNLPNSNLTTGHYYIQTIKNSDTEILQYLYNTGDYGANIYSRQKNGNSWSVWRAIAPNVRYEETTNFTLAGANPSYENYYPTTISTIGLPDENIFDGFEVQAIVNTDGISSNPTPMLYNANLVYNASSPNVITIGFKVFDYESEAGKFYVKFRVLDWR